MAAGCRRCYPSNHGNISITGGEVSHDGSNIGSTHTHGGVHWVQLRSRRAEGLRRPGGLSLADSCPLSDRGRRHAVIASEIVMGSGPFQNRT
jgi:hypothetical protein